MLERATSPPSSRSTRGDHPRRLRLSALGPRPSLSNLIVGGTITREDRKAPLWPKVTGARDQTLFEQVARERYDSVRHSSSWQVIDNFTAKGKERPSIQWRSVLILLAINRIQPSQLHRQERCCESLNLHVQCPVQVKRVAARLTPGSP